MSDTPTLVRFSSGWERDGNGPDGLPLYRETVRVRMDRPPFLSLERVAEQQDIDDHPGPYELYTKTREARKAIVGYPLALWPACLPHVFEMCAARDIHTVEQLAQVISGKRKAEASKTMPPDVLETAERAVKMIELHGKAGQYEDIVSNLEGQLAAVIEEREEMLKTISAQKALIDTLRMKAAV